MEEEIPEIPNDENDKNLEEKLIQVLSKIQVNVSSSDIEACHCVANSSNMSKKTTKKKTLAHHLLVLILYFVTT